MVSRIIITQNQNQSTYIVCTYKLRDITIPIFYVLSIVESSLLKNMNLYNYENKLPKMLQLPIC